MANRSWQLPNMPGQEEVNLPFIQRHGLGWIALTPAQQLARLAALVHDRSLTLAMAKTVHTYAKQNMAANEKTVPLIRSLLCEKA